MKSFLNRFRFSAVMLTILGLGVPAVAAHTEQVKHGSTSGGSSTITSKSAHKKSQDGSVIFGQKLPVKVIPAPNGNTGYSGIGLPKPLESNTNRKVNEALGSANLPNQ